MTEPERAALDHIRRVVDAVIGDSPQREESTSTVPPMREVNCLPVPYLSQLVGEAAVNDSGAVVGAMLVRAYTGNSSTPADFLNQVGEYDEALLSLSQVSDGLRASGIPVETRSNLKMADLALVLFSGRPAIVPVKQAVLRLGGLTPESFEGSHHLVCVGLDQRYLYAHDPLRRDASGEAQPIPWLTFYRAWTQAPGSERSALVPRMQLLRRVRVTGATLNILRQPHEEISVIGIAESGDVFEVSAQKDGWGKVGTDRWIDLNYVADI
jgi:hypothetical protein